MLSCNAHGEWRVVTVTHAKKLGTLQQQQASAAGCYDLFLVCLSQIRADKHSPTSGPTASVHVANLVNICVQSNTAS
jgi:hypothetical protein